MYLFQTGVLCYTICSYHVIWQQKNIKIGQLTINVLPLDIQL